MSNQKALRIVDPTKFYELKYGDNIVIYVKSVGVGKHTKLILEFQNIKQAAETYFDEIIKLLEKLVHKITVDNLDVSCEYFINEVIESPEDIGTMITNIFNVNDLTDDESKNSPSLSEQSTADPVKETSVEKPAVVESAPVSTIPTQTEQ